MLGLVTLLTIDLLLCFMLFFKKKLKSMTVVSPSKRHAKYKLPNLTVIVSKLSSFYLNRSTNYNNIYLQQFVEEDVDSNIIHCCFSSSFR